MADKTGGPAFPHMMRHVDENIVEQLTHGGMTLRDWFAGQALMGIASGGLGGEEYGQPTGTTAVRQAYQIAEAMLAEREKRG